MKAKSIAVNTALNTLRMTLNILVPLITYPYIARIFGSSGIGQYEWVKSVVSIFTLVSTMGIGTYAVREGAKVRENREQFTKFAQELFILNLCATAVCYVVLFSLTALVSQFNLYSTYLFIYSVNIGLSALSLDWVYDVYEDYLYITVRQIIVQLVSVAGLFLFVQDKDDLVLYIIITTVSNSGANIFNFLRARKYVDFKPQKKYELAAHLVPVLVFFGTRFAMNAYNSLDTFVLGLLTTDDEVGYYNVAVKINTILVTFFTAMSPVYLPRMMKYVSSGQNEEYEGLLLKAIKLKTILIYPIVGGLFVFAPQIIWLIAGDGFENAVLTLRILCFVLGFVLLSSIVQRDVMIPNGGEKTVLGLTIFAAVINVAVSCVLIVRIGYNGAAWGSLIAEGAVFIGGAVTIRRRGLNLFKLIFSSSYRYIIGALLMCAVCFAMGKLISSNMLVVCAGIPAAAAVYFGAVIGMKDEFLCTYIALLAKKAGECLRKKNP